jgi:hypothetical protein
MLKVTLLQTPGFSTTVTIKETERERERQTEREREKEKGHVFSFLLLSSFPLFSSISSISYHRDEYHSVQTASLSLPFRCAVAMIDRLYGNGKRC